MGPATLHTKTRPIANERTEKCVGLTCPSLRNTNVGQTQIQRARGENATDIRNDARGIRRSGWLVNEIGCGN
jgi:hypothetical protein